MKKFEINSDEFKKLIKESLIEMIEDFDYENNIGSNKNSFEYMFFQAFQEALHNHFNEYFEEYSEKMSEVLSNSFSECFLSKKIEIKFSEVK